MLNNDKNLVNGNNANIKESFLISGLEKANIPRYTPGDGVSMAIKFILNLDKFSLLCKMKDWKHPPSDLAKATGYSRSYCLKVIKMQEKLSDIFMLKMIKISGADPSNPQSWGSLFIPLIYCDLNPSSKHLNMEKYLAKYPYSFGSKSYHLRKNDNKDYCEEPCSDWISGSGSGL